MVYEGADGSARWEVYWTSPRNTDGAARWTYASHWPIDRYSPNLAEVEFSEVRLEKWPPGIYDPLRLGTKIRSIVKPGVLLVGAAGSKVDASPPAHERVSSTNPHQQGHGGSLDPALKKSLDAAFEKSFRQSGVPGAIAAVRTPKGTWVSTPGVANKASGKPMLADMHHRIGSITKTFTATLLLRAAAEGRLSLDDTIDQYVKGVPNGDEITLRQMANMSSGIASYTADKQWAEEALSHPRKVWKPREVAPIGIKDSPVFDPGKGWQYSNTNYVLLGLVLEQVTDKPIGKLYQKEIIRSLHLRETSFPNADPLSLSRTSTATPSKASPTGSPQR